MIIEPCRDFLPLSGPPSRRPFLPVTIPSILPPKLESSKSAPISVLQNRAQPSPTWSPTGGGPPTRPAQRAIGCHSPPRRSREGRTIPCTVSLTSCTMPFTSPLPLATAQPDRFRDGRADCKGLLPPGSKWAAAARDSVERLLGHFSKIPILEGGWMEL